MCEQGVCNTAAFVHPYPLPILSLPVLSDGNSSAHSVAHVSRLQRGRVVEWAESVCVATNLLTCQMSPRGPLRHRTCCKRVLNRRRRRRAGLVTHTRFACTPANACGPEMSLHPKTRATLPPETQKHAGGGCEPADEEHDTTAASRYGQDSLHASPAQCGPEKRQQQTDAVQG